MQNTENGMPINPGLLIAAILAMVDETTKEMAMAHNPDLGKLYEPQSCSDEGENNECE
jgi:hypothetical protein